jgi:hypothetical protein
MKVLSFDVGIKNLAACIVEWDDYDNNNEDIKSNLKIHYWTIINLLTSQTDSDKIINDYKCCCKDSKKNDCTKKAKSYVEFNNIKYYFCTKHLSSKDDVLSPIINIYAEENWLQEKNLNCEICELTQLADKIGDNTSIDTEHKDICIHNSISKDKIKTSRKMYYINKLINKTLCSKHYKTMIDKIETAKKKVSLIKNKKVKDMTSDDLKFHLVKCLDERKIDLLNVDMVLIENQPTFKNPTMKAISDTLYTWFMIRGIADKEINNSTIQKIKFISPSNKLKEFDQTNIEEASENKKYKETKKLSVENTKTILLSYDLNQWINVIMSHQKKDDLADSFLQGWYVLNNMNEDKLYKQWRILYDSKVIKVADLVEKKLTDKEKKGEKKKKGIKINLNSNNESDETIQLVQLSKSDKTEQSDQNDINILNLGQTAKTKNLNIKSTIRSISKIKKNNKIDSIKL